MAAGQFHKTEKLTPHIVAFGRKWTFIAGKTKKTKRRWRSTKFD